MRQWARLRPLASVRHRQAADEPGARPMTHFLDTQACIHETISRMSSKDVGLRIRVEKELRESFQGACMAENRSASEVLREFMQAFADHHQGGLQADLFASQSARKPRRLTKRKPT